MQDPIDITNSDYGRELKDKEWLTGDSLDAITSEWVSEMNSIFNSPNKEL